MILIDSEIRIASPEAEHFKFFIDTCTILNPKFIQVSNLKLSLAHFTSRLLFFYQYDEKHKILNIPIGLLNKVKELYPDDILIDKRLYKSSIPFPNIKFLGNLRDYQTEAVNILANEDMGVIEAMTGSGKTVMMIKHIIDTKRPTLIMVNTIELANQFIDRLCEFTNLTKSNIGLLGAGHKILRPITVALLQTMVKLDKCMLDFINLSYTQILTDEVHIIAAETYYKAIKQLRAKYKYGFSATPKRGDGLTKVIHFATGPTIHVVPKNKLKDILVMPKFRTVTTDYFFPLFNASEFQTMISDMAIDNERNSIIIDLVKQYKTKQIIILCNRASQVLYLHNKIPESEFLLSQIPELTTYYKPIYRNNKLVSKVMPKKARQKVIDNLNSGKTRCIISTFGLFSTGIDIAGLEVLIIGSPIKSEIKLRQSLGRLMRKGDGTKNPTVIDLVDNKIELLRWQAKVRNQIIKKTIS